MRPQLRLVTLLAGLTCFGCSAVSVAVPAATNTDEAAITRLAARWTAAAETHDGASLALLSTHSREYYPGLRQLALLADAATVQTLEPIDQLQVLFLRLMLERQQLQAMNAQQLLAFALKHGLIGQDLRAADVLRELAITDETAQGRLYKFGRDDWPDRGLQYFVREEGVWRIDLRSEWERLRTDFEAFVARSQMSAGEAAFFILETRLMRKVVPTDFIAPQAAGDGSGESLGSERPGSSRASIVEDALLRLVAIRRSVGDPQDAAVTIEDRVESLRYVLRVGDALPAHPEYRLTRIEHDAAVVRVDGAEITLHLESGTGPLGQRLPPASSGTGKTLLQLAEEGSQFEGMMAQWRNVGLRDRAQLLQQAWLTADYSTPTDAKPAMNGLRVRKLIAGSFWQQLGLQEGDLLQEINGLQVNSMDAWQQVMEIAQNDMHITIMVDRNARKHSYHTETIRPR